MTVLAVATTITLSPRSGAMSVPAALSATRGEPVLDIAVRPQRAGCADPPVPTEHLLRAYPLMPPGDPERGRLRARAVEDNLPLAYRMARRYAGYGERPEEVAQVAALALVIAVDGYDAGHAAPFISCAVPTILGALKRHLRDSAWGIRVPRSTQQLLLDLPAATADLTQLRGRFPTPTEFAAHLKVDIDDLDPDCERVNEGLSQESLRSFVAELPLRERRIVVMRFYDEMAQDRIADEIGIVQVHVSRLLEQSLAGLRIACLAADAVSGLAPRVPLTCGGTDGGQLVRACGGHVPPVPDGDARRRCR